LQHVVLGWHVATRCYSVGHALCAVRRRSSAWERTDTAPRRTQARRRQRNIPSTPAMVPSSTAQYPRVPHSTLEYPAATVSEPALVCQSKVAPNVTVPQWRCQDCTMELQWTRAATLGACGLVVWCYRECDELVHREERRQCCHRTANSDDAASTRGMSHAMQRSAQHHRAGCNSAAPSPAQRQRARPGSGATRRWLCL
jgi:hypothetical protein